MSVAASQATGRPLQILDTTLREGEQFGGAFFRLEQQLELAQSLDAFGIDLIEAPSPVSSPRAPELLHRLCAVNLRAQVIVHTRCVEADVQAALATPVTGLNLFYGASAEMRSYSHGKPVAQMLERAVPLVRLVRQEGRYVRFSAEDAFRSDLRDLLTLFDAVVEAGAQRIGLPDSVGIATPHQVEQLVRLCVARYPGIGIEFHGHNDTGCALANTIAAYEAGADCLDVTILGIGERNGIAALSGVIALLYSHYPETLAGYDLMLLAQLDRYVAECLQLPIPFNLPITAPGAFTHRAGVHTRAILRNPRAYEILDPAAFGLTRSIDLGSRLTGRHAIGSRVSELGLCLDGQQLSALTSSLKERAEDGALSSEAVDTFIQTWYQQQGSRV